MHKEENKIIYSPSDLTLYMDSPFASWMEHKAIVNPELATHADPVDEMMILLQSKGAQNLGSNSPLTMITSAPHGGVKPKTKQAQPAPSVRGCKARSESQTWKSLGVNNVQLKHG